MENPKEMTLLDGCILVEKSELKEAICGCFFFLNFENKEQKDEWLASHEEWEISEQGGIISTPFYHDGDILFRSELEKLGEGVWLIYSPEDGTMELDDFECSEWCLARCWWDGSNSRCQVYDDYCAVDAEIVEEHELENIHDTGWRLYHLEDGRGILKTWTSYEGSEDWDNISVEEWLSCENKLEMLEDLERTRR